ncbi:syntenin-1-like [Tropilaelaps mercedesae]|uniref:Syntenin-1-like n=1 Tax=Tropilaelaps mercedesae TaxID=418985 RepID=A0A1V9XJT3_9ACAR|nr:syntenin-1-like [Tropilaelaps mercedesae]
MANLYPSLEDMKVDQLMRAQDTCTNGPSAPPSYSSTPLPASHLSLYPTLDDYMGLSLRDLALPGAPYQESTAMVAPLAGGRDMMAPLSGNSIGLYRGQVTHGVREVILCKDARGKVGLRLEAINKGVFVVLVEKDTPASTVGLRFGDQVLSVNDEYVAGYSLKQVHEVIRKAPGDRITMAVRDRPFERTVTMIKDSNGYCGFDFKDGKINTLVKDSSAARNGLLIDHHLLEVNGQNVVGVKDSQVKDLIRASSQSITVTVMPSVIFEHLDMGSANRELALRQRYNIDLVQHLTSEHGGGKVTPLPQPQKSARSPDTLSNAATGLSLSAHRGLQAEASALSSNCLSMPYQTKDPSKSDPPSYEDCIKYRSEHQPCSP